jgi:hypothetical protein
VLCARVRLSPKRTVDAIIEALVVEYFMEKGVCDWSRLLSENLLNLNFRRLLFTRS